jgi:putative colanic acid biosynthesis acetyltransferase WcaF
MPPVGLGESNQEITAMDVAGYVRVKSLPSGTDKEIVRNLAAYDNSGFDPGRGAFVRAIWYYTSLLFFENGWLPVSPIKCVLLRIFGASVGKGVVIKQSVRIKFPWKLAIGEYSWVGQEVWIDNLDKVTIEENCCISQGVYICSGSHNRHSATFELMTGEIMVKRGAWVAARSTLLAGAIVQTGEVVSAGTVRGKDPSVKLAQFGKGSTPL